MGGTSDQPLPIDDRLTYPLPSFLQTVKWGRKALTEARKRGLKVRKISGRCFVLGRDFSEFLATLPTDDNEVGK